MQQGSSKRAQAGQESSSGVVAVRVKKKFSTARRAPGGGQSSLLSLICFGHLPASGSAANMQ